VKAGAKLLLMVLGTAAGLSLAGVLEKVAEKSFSAIDRASLVQLMDAGGAFFRPVVKKREKRFVQVAASVGSSGERQSFPAAKPAGNTRIIVVGESSAVLLAEAFKTLMEQRQDASRTEIINLGVSGASLETVEKVFDEAVDFSADAIVIFFGNNLELTHPVLRPGFRPFRWVVPRSLVLRALAVRPLDRTFTTEERLKMWEAFVRRAARLSKERGFKLVVSTVQGNLWWPPSRKLEHTEDVLGAIYEYYGGRPREAVARLARHFRRNPSPAAAFLLGDWLHEEGRFREARPYLQLSSDQDFMRAKSDFNRLTRRVAREEGVLLFDEAAWVAAQSPDGIPGWELFTDSCHLTPLLFEKAAYEMLARLQAEKVVSAAPGWSPVFRAPPNAPLDTLIRGLADGSRFDPLRQKILRGGRPDPYEIERELADVEDGAAQAGLALAAAEAFFRLGRVDAARRLNAQAAALSGPDPEPYVQRALFALKRDPQDACRHFARALRAAPDDPQARYFADRTGCGRMGIIP
jgi:tetratricopeptide (TPR) repeat protein